VTGNRIHHPKAFSRIGQVLGAISQQVPAADTVILFSALAASCRNPTVACVNLRILF
jgi:hypothetical protein